MKLLRLSNTHPLSTIFWQAVLIACVVLIITLLASTDPLSRGFDVFFFPFMSLLISLTLLPFIHALFTPDGLHFSMTLSFGHPPKSPLRTDNPAPKNLGFHYEKKVAFSLGKQQ